MKTKTDPVRVVVLAVCSALLLAMPAWGDLVHRYSFNETSGTTVEDSVGTADGEIKGDGAYFDGAGQLYLPGGTTSASTTPAGYVDLPNHIINVLPSLTIETWITWQGSQNWERIFDFGVSQGGEDVVNGEGGYLFASPDASIVLRFAVSDPVTFDEPDILNDGPMVNGQEICVTVTYDPAANTSRLYTNGVVAAAGSASVALSAFNDVNNWLGRSQWNDPMFIGSYNEFRIYSSALSPLEVAASYVSGVATPSTDPAALGTVQAVNMTVPQLTMTEQNTQQVLSSADFANIAGISLSGVAGVTFTSDNEAVLTVNAAGLVTAVAPGTATITLSYQGATDSETITVNARPPTLVVAGSLYVDLRAADTSASTTTWPNRAGQGDFVAYGTPTYVADVAGTGIAGVQFNPTTPATDAYEGPVTTADLDLASDRSIEVWAYNPAIAAEETLVALGRRGGPDGSNCSFNYGANGTYGAVGHWGAPDMGWSGAPAAGQWHYLVYTYDGVSTARVYADGMPKTTEAVGTLATHFGLPIRIAAQATAAGTDFDFGQALSGYIALVRIHTGWLSDADVANNFLYGPTLNPPGALQTVALSVSPATLRGARDYGLCSVSADYENLKGVSVLGFSTFASSDTNVVTVNAAGRYTAVRVGTATITATYRGMTGSQLITVVAPPVLELKHRYSFNEAVGSTTVDDSVGAADGVVKGEGAAFDGAGQLSVPGGVTSNNANPAGYVDLPNHIVNVLVNASFEAWVTWEGASAWQRIFDFGTSAGGEDVANGNGAYVFASFSPDAANLRFAVRDPLAGNEPNVLSSPAPVPTGQEIHVVATYNLNQNASVLYSNAVAVATGGAAVALHTINDVNNWLGRSQWDDAMFQGSYNEFRIWEGALSADQVAASFAAGPNQLPDVSPAPTMAATFEGGSLVLRWPAAATGFGMESTVALGPQASWAAVDISGAVDEGTQKKLTVPVEGTTKFYRMKK